MDALDRKLLNLMQTDFPVVSRPYDELGVQLGITGDEVIARLSHLLKEGMIRRIGAFFDPRKLGYYSTLCALAVPEEGVEETAGKVNRYPEVTHNYLRDHRYNMWFTLIAPSRDRASAILEEILESTGLEKLLDLPAIRVFKIRAVFDLEGGEGNETATIGPGTWVRGEGALSFNETERALIRALQPDLPLEANPFSMLGDRLSLTEGQVLAGIRELLTGGAIRRIGPALRHRRLGFPANAMMVGRVPEEQVPATGSLLAASRRVTHCYQRVPSPSFPYNLFAMIHGPDFDFCRRLAAGLAGEAQITQYELLFSSAELKKSTMQYMMEEKNNG